MNKFFIFFSVILCLQTTVFAQRIIRSSMSSFGNITYENGTTFRQTIGQPSGTSVFLTDGNTLRQGFQQPISHGDSRKLKEKRCTLYLNPNPTTDVVFIKFNEEIGDNIISVFDIMGKLQFKITVTSPSYEMDISKLSKGMYMVNVISKSGYYCSEKLVVN
ncbi:MAG: T9SS type A sorting domain-containing protein [Bacteroidetes bacterium]|nr:T9SS type A sorting domain-containing protein [Bacteroidota bacterium]